MKARLTLIPLLLMVVATPLASAQNAPDLRALAREAGIIFIGTVEMIQPLASRSRGDIGVVRITFRVNDALRGASPGAVLTVSEWDELWTSGDRYRVGEQLLLFLYPPSGELGLTSVVGGSRGRISPSDTQLSLAELARQIGEPSVPSPPQLTKPRRLRRFSRPRLHAPMAE